MTTDPDLLPEAPEPGTGAGSIWLWLLVVAFGAAAAVAGYSALSKTQLYWESEAAREALQHDKGRLEANLADAKRQLKQANGLREETDNALRQSRADTETAQTQIGELQAKANDLESKLAAATADAREAGETNEGLKAEVARLQGELAATQQKLAETQKTLEATQKRLQSTQAKLDDTQAKLDATSAKLKSAAAELEKAKQQEGGPTTPNAAQPAPTAPSSPTPPATP